MSESRKQTQTIIIAGGGTGGHVFPALSIAHALKKENQDLKLKFVGTRTGLEAKVIPKENFEIDFISIGRLNTVGISKEKITTMLKLPWAFVQSAAILLRERPSYVIGVGGYASGPFVLMAALMGFRTALWEPNAMPGLANRILSRFVDQCFVVFEESKKYFKNSKVQSIGMPTRTELRASRKSDFVEGEKEFHLLHFGGSQGARAIGNALSDAVLSGGPWLHGLKIKHQTGSLDYERLKAKYKNHPQVEVTEFIFDMKEAYSWADLVISRAGASTVNELAAFGLPSILIPLPLADGHQEKNAEVFASVGAGVLLPQGELTSQRLIQEITALRADQKKRKQMSEQSLQFYKPDAAADIARAILDKI